MHHHELKQRCQCRRQPYSKYVASYTNKFAETKSVSSAGLVIYLGEDLSTGITDRFNMPGIKEKR